MASNEYFRAIKHTEHLTRESRDELRTQSGMLSRQSGLLQQQVNQGKKIAAAQRVIAVANVAQVVQQQRLIAQQKQIAEQQAESLQLQYREAEEARKHRFAMWRQTPDGAAFTEWQQTAEAVAAILDSREYRWRASWDAAVARLRAEIPQADIDLAHAQGRIALPPSAKQRTANLWRVGAIAAAGIGTLGLFGALIGWMQVAISGPFGGSHIGDAIANTLLLLVAGGAAVFGFSKYLAGRDTSHITEARRLETERAAAQTQRSQDRILRYGFDPLYVQPGFAWYRWYAEDAFEGYADAIRAFIAEAQTTFPAAATLPELRLPDVIDPAKATLPEQAAALTAFQTEQTELVAG